MKDLRADELLHQLDINIQKLENPATHTEMIPLLFERVDKLGLRLQSVDPMAHLNHVNQHLNFYLASPTK